MLMFPVGVCKQCGCTDNNACITEVGPCSWVNEEHDLCSACFDKYEGIRGAVAMSIVREWSNKELNRALAELMGYSVIADQGFWLKKPDGSRIADAFSKNTEEIAWSWAPDYAVDHAASKEIQNAAYAVSPEWYLHYLAMRTNKEDLSLDEFPDPFEVYGPELVGAMVTAEPREIAEAAYMVLNQSRDK